MYSVVVLTWHEAWPDVRPIALKKSNLLTCSLEDDLTNVFLFVGVQWVMVVVAWLWFNDS